MTPRRLVELFLVPLALLASFVVPALAWADRLPNPIASHWDLHGVPDGSMSVNGSLWLFATIWITAWIAAVIGLQVQKVAGQEARFLVALLYWFGAFLSSIWVFGLIANLDVTDWRQAGAVGGLQVLGSLVAGVAVGAIGWFLAGDRPGVHEPIGQPVAPVTAPDGHAALWSGTAANLGLVALTVPPTIAIGILAAFDAGAWPVVPMIGLAILLIGMLASRVRATAGPHGLRISLGWFGWPTRTIRAEQIRDVRVEDVLPLTYGGWGFRVAKGAQAYVIRRGPGIRVSRTRGLDIVVTVDDAERGAAVLAGHLTHLDADQPR